MTAPRLGIKNPSRCPLPKCGGESEILVSRDTPEWRWRRRHCLRCGHRWPTWETLINPRRLRPVAPPGKPNRK